MACKVCGKPIKRGHPACERKRRAQRRRLVANPRKETRRRYRARVRKARKWARRQSTVGVIRPSVVPPGRRVAFRASGLHVRLR